MATKESVVIFPFMAKGHIIPLLHLADFLSSHHRHLSISLITTPANAAFFHRHLPSHIHPNISILSLPFPSLPPLPAGIESTDTLPSPSLYPTFLRATMLLLDPFCQLLSNFSPPPICLISDFFLGWTLPFANELDIPHIVFHGMSVFSMALCQSFIGSNTPKDDQPFTIPGTPPSLLLTRDLFPDTINKFSNLHDPLIQVLLNYVLAMDGVGGSQGILVNSFIDIEQGYVELFESFYSEGARAWLVGPLCMLASSLLNEEIIDEEGCLAWLDERERKHESVVYVSFGTQTHVPNEQLDEVAHGLISSGHPFIWAVRSKTWIPPESLVLDISARGKIVRGWVPQKQVLEHAATSAFLSHCGWNSVLESICCGVPILCWPMIAEQPLNEKHVVDLLGAGVGIGTKRGEIVDRKAVERGVKRVMEDDKLLEKAAELQRAAGEAVADGGSSQLALEQLLNELIKVRNNKTKRVDSSSDKSFEKCSQKGFIDIEQGYVELFESFYREGARAWLVGPLCMLARSLINEEIIDEEGCLAWLDERERKHESVVYVSFGTQTHVPNEQLDEVAHGLISSGHPFIWAVRSKTWIPPESLVLDISARGKIVRGWVPQKQVLEHAATSAFLSHCGWNSVLESICCGVPILCWPMIAEQALNEKHVVDLLGAGVGIGTKRGEIVDRKAVERGVKRVMEDDKLLEKAAELQRAAGEAVAGGGSSQLALEQLLNELIKVRNNKTKRVDSSSDKGFEKCSQNGLVEV